MREIGTVVLAAVFAVSLAYLIAEHKLLRQALAAKNANTNVMPPRVEKAFIGVGVIGVIIGFALYFIGG